VGEDFSIEIKARGIQELTIVNSRRADVPDPNLELGAMGIFGTEDWDDLFHGDGAGTSVNGWFLGWSRKRQEKARQQPQNLHAKLLVPIESPVDTSRRAIWAWPRR